MIAYDLNDKRQIDLLDNSLRELALNNLKPLLLEYAVEININENEFDLRESLSLLLKGQYLTPVFEMRIDFFHSDNSHGYYRLITDMNLNAIDDFFVLR